MTKQRAEPAPGEAAPRWIGSGRTVFDNKGNPVKQYEPFFSETSAFEDEPELVEAGVTPILRYDPLGRLIRTDLPDGTHTRVAFGPWHQETWDGSDTVLGTPWLSRQMEGSVEQQRAATLCLPHGGTPTVAHLDALGRAYLSIADNGPEGLVETRVSYDLAGNALTVTDARGVEVQAQRFDMLGQPLRTDSPDAGTSWTLNDVAGRLLYGADDAGVSTRSDYDALGRPTHVWVTTPESSPRLAQRLLYGESLGAEAAASLNLLGQPVASLDGAGLVQIAAFDSKGNLPRAQRSGRKRCWARWRWIGNGRTVSDDKHRRRHRRSRG